MNIEEYISTGILESYVLDQLSAKEREEVEQMASSHSEIREEIDRIERAIETLALTSAVSVPKQVKDAIMGSVAEEHTPVVPIGEPEDRGSFLKIAIAASLAVAIGSSILAFSYWNRWRSAEDKLADLVAQNQQFADNYNLVNRKLDNIQNAVKVMNDPSFARVTMNGTDNSPASLATIYWNKETEAVFLSVQDLQNLSQDQQYQLWAIVDGVPVDAGVFDADDSSYFVQMNNIGSNVAAFAVTIEPRGGSKTPSLETMQVIGNV